MTKKNETGTKKSLEGSIYESIAIILFLVVAAYAFKEHNANELLTWSIVPLVPFIMSCFYRVDKIGRNLKNLGIAFAGIFSYLHGIGINGLPALSILVLMFLFIANFFSTEKVWSEMIKIVGGIVSGSLAQAKISTYQSNKTNKK